MISTIWGADTLHGRILDMAPQVTLQALGNTTYIFTQYFDLLKTNMNALAAFCIAVSC